MLDPLSKRLSVEVTGALIANESPDVWTDMIAKDQKQGM